MIRFYFMPLVEINNYRIPKYFAYEDLSHDGVNASHRVIDYGKHPVCFVTADVTIDDHLVLAEYNDIIALPGDIETSITREAISALMGRFEELNVPLDWVTPGMLWRDVIRKILCLFMFSQRYYGLYNARIIEDDDSLDAQYDSIQDARRQRYLETKRSFGDRDPVLTNARSTLRNIMMRLSDSFGDRPINIGFGMVV